MLKEDIKKILDNRKAPFKMELKGEDLTPFIVEQIMDMFAYVQSWLGTLPAEYQETFSCECFYWQEYDPNPAKLRKMRDHLLEDKEVIEKIEFVIYYDEEEDSIGAPTLYVTRRDACDECTEMPRRVAEIKEAMCPDSLLQGSIYSHGLATGFGVNHVSAEIVEMNLKSFSELLNSEKEICCSWKTQQIGGFGLFVRGEVTIASNRDLWSYIGWNEARDFNVDDYGKYIISRREELRLGWQDHTEFFVKPKEVIAFWAKRWFVRDVPGGRELVEKLRKEGHKVYITKSLHR